MRTLKMDINLKPCYVLVPRMEVIKAPEWVTSKQDLRQWRREQKRQRMRQTMKTTTTVDNGNEEGISQPGQSIEAASEHGSSTEEISQPGTSTKEIFSDCGSSTEEISEHEGTLTEVISETGSSTEDVSELGRSFEDIFSQSRQSVMITAEDEVEDIISPLELPVITMVEPEPVITTNEVEDSSRPTGTGEGMQEYLACIFCPMKFSKEVSLDLMFHMYTHKDERPYHSTKFCSPSEKLSPIQRKEMYQCLICWKVFNWKMSLLSHLRASHKNDSTDEALNWNERFVGVVLPAPNVIYTTEDQLKKKMVKDDYPMAEPQKKRSQPRPRPKRCLEAPITAKDAPPPSSKFDCDVCGLSFQYPGSLRGHKLLHGIVKKHRCLICFQLFNRMCSLSSHLEQIHKIDTTNEAVDWKDSFTDTVDVTDDNAVRPHGELEQLKEVEVTARDSSSKLARKRNVQEYLPCVICREKFKSQRLLTLHLKKEHMGNRPYLCTECDTTFKSSGILKKHIRTVHYTPSSPLFKCDICGKSFQTLSSLRQHKLFHKVKEKYQCLICRKVFHFAGAIRNHLQTVHEINIVNQGYNWKGKYVRVVTWQSPSPNGGDAVKVQLKKRKKERGEQEFLERDDRDWEETTTRPRNVKKIGKRGRPKSVNLKCVFCDKQFKISWSLTQHLRSHTNERPYFCSKCDATYKSPSHLKEHLNGVHGDDNNTSPRLICKICGKSFRYSSSFKNHKSMHQRKEMFQCLICSQVIARLANVPSHLQWVHKIDTKKEVLDWKDRFVRVIERVTTHDATSQDKDRLSQNKLVPAARRCSKSKRGNKGTKILTCVICNENYEDEQVFIEHMKKSHVGKVSYLCGKCDATFESSGELKEHTSAEHKSSSPEFKCSLCGKSFQRRRSLQKHKEVHEGRDKYQCLICLKIYFSKKTIQNHLEKVHGIVATDGEVNYKEKGVGIDHEQNTSDVVSNTSEIEGQPKTVTEEASENVAVEMEINHDLNERTLRPRKAKKKVKRRPKLNYPNRKCVFCEKEFKRSSWDFERHLISHVRERPYFCTMCPATFRSSGHLNEHCSAAHDESSEGFTCDVCGLSFRHPGTLRGHKLIHKNKRMYECGICSTMFYWKHTLERHLRRIHKIADEADDWEEKFLRVVELAEDSNGVHVTKDQSEEKVQDSSSAEGDSLFVCKICGKKFNHGRNLRSHELRHEEKKFECFVCKKNFHYQFEVVKHLLTCHKS